MLGLPYVGNSVSACAIAQRKSDFKIYCHGLGLKTPEWDILHQPSDARDVAERLHYPFFVKPNSQGDSFGVSLVQSPDALDTAVQAARAYDVEVLAESQTLGTEVTIGVYRRAGRVEVLPPLAVSSTIDDYLSRAAKSSNKIRVVPADLVVPSSLLREAAVQCTDLFREMGGRAFCRFDGIAGMDGEFSFIEANVTPGMVPGVSFLPEMLRLEGLDLGALLDDMIGRALSGL